MGTFACSKRSGSWASTTRRASTRHPPPNLRTGAGNAQTETTPFHPTAPTAVAKLYGYWITVNYREERTAYACDGEFFSRGPRRLETSSPARITREPGHRLLDSSVACSRAISSTHCARSGPYYTRDYVRMQWMMLQQDTG